MWTGCYCFLLVFLSFCYNVWFCLLQLQDYGKNPAGETDVQFRVTLEPMLRLMAYIGQQLSAPANRVAVINLQVCYSEFLTNIMCLDLFTILLLNFASQLDLYRKFSDQ